MTEFWPGKRNRAGGAKVIERLAHDLPTAFPDMKGFSPRNLKYMRAFAEAWPDTQFVQEVPAPQSDLAREIEHALVKHVTEFLLELGAGFAFVGRQLLRMWVATSFSLICCFTTASCVAMWSSNSRAANSSPNTSGS
jgi:hypothetical protein